MATRRERVVLTLDDDFSSGMARAAAATALLNRELNSLSGMSVSSSRSSQVFIRDVQRMGNEARGADRSINQLTGRLRVLGEVVAVLSPALAPAGGVLIAGVAGLANQMGAAAIAGGVLIGSLQGVGDALGAMNKAQLDPTNKNLEAAEDALKRLSPAARDFAEAAFDLKPALVAIRDLGAESLIPGLTESLDSLERLGPRVTAIFQAVGEAMGGIAADSSASLASERWEGFFEFIQREVPGTMQALATTVGDLTHGMAELWEAFTPLNNDFSSWLMGVADGFDRWATGLSATEGFAEFVSYIQTTGPQLAETLGAIANAVVQIVQATAPLATPVLAGLEAAANAIAAIADSDLGTPIMGGVAALALLNRSLAVTASLSKVSLASGFFGGIGAASKGIKGQAGSIKADIAAMSDKMVVFGANTEKAGAAAARMKQRLAGGAGLAGLAVAATGAADGLGLTNTMSLALMGSLAGPPGVAIGAAAGALMDLKSAGEGATDAIQGLDAAVQSGDMGVLSAQIAAAKTELADITELDFGGDIFDRIAFQWADTFGGPSMDEARRKIEESEEALLRLARAESAAEGEAKRAALTYARSVAGNMDLSKWARRSSEDIKAQADAFAGAAEAGQKTAQSFLGLRDSLNDSKVSLGGWLADLEKSARALRNFNDNSIKAARRGLDEGLILSLREAGEEGARRMQQLANGTEGAIKRANKAHQSQTRELERTERVTQRLAGLDPVVKVKAETASAMSSINAVESMLNNIPDEEVFINVTRRMNAADTQLGPRASADGGTVPKTGKPYADRHLYLLADGEEVISNRHGQADRHRSLLKAINGGLADGGTTGRKGDKRKVGASFFAPDNTSALQAAIDRLTMVSQDQTAAVEDATRRTDEWSQRMESVAQATVAGFDTGLFERDSNAWASGAGGGPVANLMRDIAGLQERGSLQAQLAGMGITGDALAALLAQGSNSDLSSLIASGQASSVAALFNQRAALQGSVGAAAGQQAFGAQYAAALKEQQAATAVARATQAEIARINTQMARNTAALERMERNHPSEIGNATARALDGAAAGGQRDNRNRTGARRG